MIEGLQLIIAVQITAFFALWVCYWFHRKALPYAQWCTVLTIFLWIFGTLSGVKLMVEHAWTA